jgi:hypothetical protein
MQVMAIEIVVRSDTIEGHQEGALVQGCSTVA